MKISVVIPAYNEEMRIGDTVKRIVNYCKRRFNKFELILVDDGSTDNTAEIAKKIFNDIVIIKNNKNFGKGLSIKRGVLKAKNDLVLFSDADLSTPIEELDNFIRYIKDYDIVIGSRNLSDSRIIIKQNNLRMLYGKTFSKIVNLFLLKDIKDSQCGFKLFKKRAINTVFNKQKIGGFGFDVETLYIAHKYNLRIKEVPVTWINDGQSKVRLKLDPFIMLLELIKIKFNDISGVYDDSD